jgi:hypothetical protein
MGAASGLDTNAGPASWCVQRRDATMFLPEAIAKLLLAVVVGALIGALIILWVFPRFEQWIYNVREMRTYELVCDIKRDRLKELEDVFQSCGLGVKGHKLVKKDEEMVCLIDAYGPPEKHETLLDKLLTETDVKEFRY